MYHHIKFAFRHIVKDRQTAFLHFAGLSLGLCVCLLIALWMRDELLYDRFHSKAHRIYRALWEARFGDNEWKIAQCPMPLAPLLASEFPEVENATQCVPGGMTFKKGPDFVREPNGLHVDEAFSKVFDLHFTEGDAATALQSPDEIVMTQTMARRFFGTGAALGQTLVRNDGQAFRVSGVVRDWPKQSHLRFDYLSPIKGNPRLEARREQWTSATALTYFTLKQGADPAVLQDKMKAYGTKHLRNGDFAQGDNYTRFPFQKLTDIYLHSAAFESAERGSIRYVWIFGMVAAAILALACINFINLATARALSRTREVGVRKTLGSTRRQLVGQFLLESAVMVCLSVVGAIAWVLIAMPAFRKLTNKSLALDTLLAPDVLFFAGMLLLTTTLVAGAVPALFFSKFAPVKALKGRLTSEGHARDRLRQGLVVAQFSISTMLMIGTLVARQQLHFFQHQSLGFQKEQVLVLKRAHSLEGKYGVFFNRIRAIKGVESAAAGQFMPGGNFDSTIFTPEQPSNYKETSLTYTFVDADFVKTLGLHLRSGHDFRPGFASDSAGCLINETCARRLGWADPIGKTLTMGGFPEGKVLGVVADFNFQSLHHAVDPLVIRLSNFPTSFAAIRLRPDGPMNDRVADIQSIWKELAPTVPFEYSFLDDDFQKQYDTETRLSQVFGVFSALGMLIACLGLFGLTTFVVARRTKEIGVRKVLGATATGIAGLLIADFLKLVALAIVLASPVAWYLTNRWLADFAYRIELQWWMFAGAGATALAIAFLTVGFQGLTAALADPVKSLRSE